MTYTAGGAMGGDRSAPAGVRRRAWRWGAWWGVVLGCVAAVLPHPVSAQPHRPSLPDRFAALPVWTSTATVGQRPAGRAIALFRYCSDDTSQATVVGADRETYRRLEPSGFDERPDSGLIAPDGTRVLLLDGGSGADTGRRVRLVDLRTGAARTVRLVDWHSNVGAGPRLLAWSDDGRYVAYAVPAPPPADGTADGSYADGRPVMDLAVLDLRTGSSARYPAIRPARGAAFAPDGRLAVQVRRQAWLVTVGGAVRDRFALPAGRDLAGPAAWSPDGALLATTVSSRPGAVHRLEFVDVPGAHRPVPAPVTADGLLGWRSADRVLAARDGRVDEVALGDRGARTASRSPAHGDQVCDLHLATGLVRQATIRPAGDPDRGSAPVWPWPAAAVVVGFGALIGYLLRRRARRSA